MPEPFSIVPAPRVLPQHPALWRGGELARTAAPGVATGFAALDRELPGGGWPVGSLAEIMPAHEGIGELRLLGPALAHLSQAGKPLFWIAPPHLPYAPALAAAGIALSQLAIVRTRTPQDTLWATEQALRANACGAVVAWPAAGVDYTALRRLQVAAEGSRALAFLFRPPRAARETSPAALRLLLDTERGGLAITIAKRRGAPLARPVVIPALGRAGPASPEQWEEPRAEHASAAHGAALPGPSSNTNHSHALDRRLPAASAA
jgi:hypothetical protein